MLKVKKKRGELLVENIIFIVLNVAFLSILVVFLLNQSSSEVLLEDAYSKNIALLVDSARPGDIMTINMDKAFEISKKEGIDFLDVVQVTGNIVSVNLDGKKGREYSFFQEYNVRACPDVDEKNEYNGNYVITVSRGNLSEACF